MISNSYTMGCPPVRGDNPRAFASGLSYVKVDKHGITILYHRHQCRPCTQVIFHALVGKGVIIVIIRAQREKGRRRYSSSIFRQTCAMFRYIAPFYNATYRTGNIPLNMDCHNPRVDLS